MRLIRYILLILILNLFSIAGSSQEKPKIKILNFEKVQNIHYNLAQEFARKTPNTNRDSVIWALLIVETNDPNIRVVSSEEIGFYLTEKLRENPRLDINNFRLPGQKWYSMRPGANKFRITHDRFRHDVELPELFNSEGMHIGRIEKNWFIPVSSIFGSTRQAEACTVYRLTIEVPQDYGGREDEKQEEDVPGFVTFTTDPVGATVKIMQNGQIKAEGDANPEFSGILSYGTYTYTVSAPNYHTEEGTFTIGADPVSKPVKLRPAFGRLTINSTPSGASVMIDGMMQSGVTPLTIPQLPSGSHTITLNKADYSQATRDVVIVDGQATVENIALDARFAMITINSLPGASIYVDNKLVGTGSYSGNLNSGTHRLKASLKSHEDATDQIQVAAKVPQTIELKPTPIYGRLTVGSSPRGADIVVGGVKRGVTPMNITDLLVGEYDVVISKAGYASHSQRVVIDEKTPVVINPTLQSGRSVTITTGVAGDDIYVDDRYIGTSPVTMELSFGTHTLMASRSDGENIASTTETVTVAQGSTPLTFTLSIMSSGLRPRWANGVTAEQRRILGNLIDNMVAVKGGTFTMGATSEQGNDAERDEKPTHNVTLSDYHIGKYEVTQEEWQAVMGKNPSYFKGAKRPVEKVSYKDCDEFIRRLNALTGIEFMLPSEAQWEYAARGGNMSRGYKFSGDNTIDNVAWYSSNSGSETHPVGQKKPNELGLYDMTGNVWEWCSDYYGDYSKGSQTNPTGPTKDKWGGSNRVDRGGCWNGGARGCRVSDRDSGSPGYGNSSLGLRLVCP